MKKILLPFLFILAVVSCQKDDTLRYNNITMGNIDGESIISDQGNTFTIVENLPAADLKSFNSGRVMLMCDVLRKTADNTYDIRLSGITEVLTKNVKSMTDSSEEEDLEVDDPVIIRERWYSGGYINLNIEFARKNDSQTIHYINLIQEDSEDGYTFTLRHNAMGDVPSEEDNTGYTSASSFVSFPISDIIKGDAAKLTIKWKSHKFTGSGYSLTETEDIVKTYDWTRQGFEQNNDKVFGNIL